ncbi:enoyl-ACP reductase FabI [bacterium]|nr:enoyl-ACP reductase FabI [bacterium]
MHPLQGKRGLVTGIANADSIAYGCARALRRQGAELAITYLNDKAAPHVRPLAEALGAPLVLPLDVEAPGQMRAVFEAIDAAWGELDFAIHALAFAPAADLRGRVTDCSAAGFQRAMHVSCYSFLELARHAEPLLRRGGTLLTLSFYGADKVVGEYNLMGPVKAALQCCVRYLARELGPKDIRVHALSPGPIRTRAASGLGGFDALIADAAARTPSGRLATIDDVGAVAAFLVGDGARAMSGDTVFVDGGRHAIG